MEEVKPYFYEFSVLSYRHFLTGEFVNLAVALLIKNEKTIIGYKHQEDLTRLQEFFKNYKDTDIDKKYIESLLFKIGYCLKTVSENKNETLKETINSVLKGDNTLQFSEVKTAFSGLNFNDTLIDLFETYVK